MTEAFVDTALNLTPADYGESFNIGTGRKTTIGEVAATARELFDIADEPSFTMPERSWDVQDWYANIDKARTTPGLGAAHQLSRGPEADHRLVPGAARQGAIPASRPRNSASTPSTASAPIVACYKDSQAIPIMYERLKATFTKLNIDFEIIFVNDCSPGRLPRRSSGPSRGTTGG